MNIKYVTVASVFAAMLALGACGTDDDTWDDTTTTDTWDDQPPPRTEPQPTQPQTTQPQTGAPADRADQTWEYDADADGMERRDDQTVGTQDTMRDDRMAQNGDVGMTEFAALDTDASGELTQEQWVAEAVGGVEFDEVDQDGDGVVTREEFRQYFLEGEGGGRQDTLQ